MAEMLTTPGRYPHGKAPASETESGIWSRKSEQQEIMPGVFITSANGAVARKRDKRALRDARISHVLRVGAEFTDERNYPTSPDLVYQTTKRTSRNRAMCRQARTACRSAPCPPPGTQHTTTSLPSRRHSNHQLKRHRQRPTSRNKP